MIEIGLLFIGLIGSTYYVYKNYTVNINDMYIYDCLSTNS